MSYNYEDYNNNQKTQIKCAGYKLPNRLTNLPTFYYVNFEKLNKDINLYILHNFFKPVEQNKSLIVDENFLPSEIINNYFHIVEKLEIKEKDLMEQPLLMSFHLKLHDVYTDEIIFDDGCDVFEKSSQAQQAYETWILQQ